MLMNLYLDITQERFPKVKDLLYFCSIWKID